MLKKYIKRFLFRIILFTLFIYLYFFNPKVIDNFFYGKLFAHFSILYFIWVILIIEIIIQINPKSKISMGCLKQFGSNYKKPEKGFNNEELSENVHKMNHRALIILIGGVSVNLTVGMLFLIGYIQIKELVLLSFIYYICDLICVIFYCPFQSIILKNRCCVTCRIFNWSHFMMYMPMLFIKSFFSWSLFFVSIVALIHWEYTYYRYPERFWEGSNKALRCSHCNDKMCTIKKPLKIN